MEQRGQDVDPDKIPIEYADLPYDAQIAYNIYNRLGNRVESNIGFVGKDYTNLRLYIDLYYITDVEFLMDLLLTLEVYFIEENAKEIKKMMDKYNKKK